MGSTRTHMAGVAAFALLSLGLSVHPAWAEQGGQSGQQGRVENSKADNQRTSVSSLSGQPTVDLGKKVIDAAPAPSAPSAPAASGSQPSPAPNASAPAAPVAANPAPVVAVPAVPPAGLSGDAPEVPPTLGVVGGGGGASSGPSPSSTPEPSTLLLMGTGLVGLYRLRKRQ
jgi:hypothetical protein